MRLQWIVVPVWMAIVTVSGSAQQPAADPSFEVASIKRNTSGSPIWSLTPQPTGQFNVTNGRVADLVQAAFQLQDYQIEGLPRWTREERYDIVAKLDAEVAARVQPPGATPPWALALRSLLAERMRLTVHSETAQRPIYALVVANRDGRLGPNIKPAGADCDALQAQALAAARQGGPSPYPPTTADHIACGSRSSNGKILYGGNTLSNFTAMLARRVGRKVEDRTNLQGKWDFVLNFTPTAVGDKPPATDAPDLFTALVEQLGLKLQPATGAVDILVVDRIERPTDD